MPSCCTSWIRLFIISLVLKQPDWALAVEMDQKAAAATRRRLFKQAAEEKLLVAGYHFPFPGIGRIVEQGASWRFVPMQTA